MTNYSDIQIAAAREMFELRGVCPASNIEDSEAIAFLDFYFAMKSEFPCNSIAEAMKQGFQYGPQKQAMQINFMRQVLRNRGDRPS